MSESSGNGLGMDTLVSGIIATAIALASIFAMSLFLPFPWSLSSTMVATGIASFSGSIVSYVLGFRAARAKGAEGAE